jgi:SAM-dependent methyltransferase
MRLVPLAESGLGIAKHEIASLFEPFVDRARTVQADAWRLEIARRKRKLLTQTAKRLLLPWRATARRGEATVLSEYSDAWRAIDYGIYGLDAPQRNYTPWEWHGQRMFASDVGATRFRQLFLIRFIERLRPRRVLEVGCGNGINLILLAGRFPKIAFTGVELTEAGHCAARELQKQAELPPALRDYAPLPLADTAAFRRIQFLQGNATSLPFEDGEFDLVITVLALEQMERVRAQALREIARVAGRHTLMIEPFQDINTALWPRLNVLRRDYFRGRIADLARCDLEPVLAFDDYPQEAFLKTCAVLAEKRGNPSPAVTVPGRRHGATGSAARRGAVPVTSLTTPDPDHRVDRPRRRTRVGG